MRFALDHNFPAPMLDAIGSMLRASLVAVSEIDPTWAELEDWQLMLALHRAQPRWDGLITNDSALLALPKEMTVLSQTNLTLVIAEGEGHNPIRAIGVLLCHLNHICHHSLADRAQVWTLRVSQKQAEAPRHFLEKIASRENTTVEAVVQANRVPARDLGRTRADVERPRSLNRPKRR